jgi:hypothetical protein
MHSFTVEIRYASMVVSPPPPDQHYTPPAPEHAAMRSPSQRGIFSALVEAHCSPRAGTWCMHTAHRTLCTLDMMAILLPLCRLQFPGASCSICC